HEEEIRQIIEDYIGRDDGRRLLREIRSDPTWRTASSERVLGFLEWAETELDSGAELGDLSGPLLTELLHSYAILHEAIYAQGDATRWSAQRVRAEFPAFDPAAAGECLNVRVTLMRPVAEPSRKLAAPLSAIRDGGRLPGLAGVIFRLAVPHGGGRFLLPTSPRPPTQ
ncbi:hypothetical protein B4Q13_15480, partial [Lacticaseibacillus rhamnosus]